MGENYRFKHVKGPARTFESICMNCLLAVGICSSEEGLRAKESQHACGERLDQHELLVKGFDTAASITTAVSRRAARI
jgi:hypothetical protein